MPSANEVRRLLREILLINRWKSIGARADFNKTPPFMSEAKGVHFERMG